MIRILHMIGSLEAGGSQAMIINLYRNIDRTRVQFDFLVDHPDRMYWEDEVKSLGGIIYTMPTFKGWNVLEIITSWKTFFQMHPEYKVLHSHVRSYASLYLPIAKKYGVTTIIHSHSTSNGAGVLSIIKKILQYPLRYQADYLVACSEKAGKWLYGKKACKKSNYLLMPNAIDAEKYQFNEEVRNKYRSSLNIENKFVLGHVGRFHESKNHMFIIDLFYEVLKERENSVLLLIGDGDLRPDIEKKIQSLSIEKHVFLLGNRGDVPEIMQAMDAFVFPSSWEGLGIAAIEAQATGLYVFASEGVPRETKISNTISYFPLNDKKMWVDTILATPKMYNRLNGYDQLRRSGYDIQHCVKYLQNFYIKVWGSNE